MEFVKGNIEISDLPTGLSDEILSKIDTIIKINDSIKGFICSTEPIPIFVGYKNFGLPSGCFEEYCKKLNLKTMVIEYNGERIFIDIRSKLFVDTVNGDSIQPYVDYDLNPDIINISTNTVGNITIYGECFDSNMGVIIDDVLDVVNIVCDKPNEIILTYNTYDDVGETVIELVRGSTRSFGKKIKVKISDIVKGSGQPGVFLTNFENCKNGENLWGVEWDTKVFGKISSVESFFKSSKAGTPSVGTGPNDVNVFTNSKCYMYTERSGENYNSGQYATVTTNNFAILDEVTFEYHLATNNTNVEVFLRAYNVKTMNWDILWSHSGPGVHKQNDKASLIEIKNINNNYNMLQFYFGETNNWGGDLALSNIKIVSK